MSNKQYLSDGATILVIVCTFLMAAILAIPFFIYSIFSDIYHSKDEEVHPLLRKDYGIYEIEKKQ